MFVKFFILTLISCISCTKYNYNIKSLTDLSNSTCKSLVKFKYDELLNFVVYNEQNENLPIKLIAVKNRTKLIQILFKHSTQEILIKDFESTITVIEPKWDFGRVYVMTYNNQHSLNRIYEVDLYFKTIAEIISFKVEQNQKVLLTSDPFHGTVTYVIENYIRTINTYYQDLSDDYVNNLESKIAYEYLGKNENFTNDSAYCIKSKYGLFEYALTSSIIDGYTKIQTYYIRTKTKYFKCLINKHICTCSPIKNSNDKIQFYKLSNYYNKDECSNYTEKENSIIIENKKSNFQNIKNLKQCLRICSIPIWKRELNNEEYVNFNSNECINNLRLNTSFDQFGVGLENVDDGYSEINSYKIRINYYEEYLEQLVSSNCRSYEIMYKYSVFYKKLDYLSEINEEQNQYSQITSTESTIDLKIDQSMYEINVMIQTPFDSKSYNLGTFVFSENFELKNPQNFTVPNFQKVKVNQIPAIYNDNWFQYISANVAIFSVYTKSLSSNSLLKYILTNISKSIVEEIVLERNLNLNYMGSEINSINNKIQFKIDNLEENTMYNLRVFSETNSNEISSFSNKFKFKTLKRPFFKINTILSDSVFIDVYLYCKLVIIESNLKYYEKKSENGCHLFKVFVKKEFSEIWEQRMEILVKDIEVKNLYDYEDNFLHSKIMVKNLSSMTNYSLKINVETYFSESNLASNSIRSISESHILSSKIQSFKTREPILVKFNHKSFILICFLIFLCMTIISFVILTIYLKKSKKFLFLNLKKKNFLDFEKETFLGNMNANMLYSLGMGKKEIKNEIDNLVKIDEKNLELLRPIGKGAFGQVFEGFIKVNDSKIRVAIKKLRDNVFSSDKFDLIKEAIALNSFNHPNLLKFYGICLSNQNSNQVEVKFILTELMNNGDLLSYLRLCRKTKQNLDYKKAIKILIDISNACAYLESISFIHRDLAARNCLINVVINPQEENITVKLGDFGMARELYSYPSKDYYKQINNINKLLPIRWMSPESICDGVYSSKSDVWSFGVIVWEVLTLGFQPYFGMQNIQVIDHIKAGGILQIPQKCPSDMRSLMMNCWKQQSDKRPTFENISSILNILYEKNLEKYKNIIPIFDETYLNEISNLKIGSRGSLKKRSNCSEFDEGFSDFFSETHESSFNRENRSLIN